MPVDDLIVGRLIIKRMGQYIKRHCKISSRICNNYSMIGIPHDSTHACAAGLSDWVCPRVDK